MEKYIKPEVEVIELEAKDVIATSGCLADNCTLEGYGPDVCGEDGHDCFDFGCRAN